MRLKYFSLVSLLIASCLISCAGGSLSSSSSSSSSSYDPLTAHDIEDVKKITHFDVGFYEQYNPLTPINTVEEEIKDNKYYLGSTYTFRFRFTDENDNLILLKLDESYLQYDKEYLKVTCLYDYIDDTYAPNAVLGMPTFYVEMLKVCQNTTLSFILPNASHTINITIIDYETADVYKTIAVLGRPSFLDDIFSYHPSGITYVHSVEQFNQHPELFSLIYQSGLRDETFFENNSYLVFTIRNSLYCDYAFMDSIMSYNNNLMLRMRAKFIQTDQYDPDWSPSFTKTYIFRVNKALIDYDISVTISTYLGDEVFMIGA